MDWCSRFPQDSSFVTTKLIRLTVRVPLTNGVAVLSYSSGPAEHIRETNSSSDEVYLIKVNKLTKALSPEKAWCCLSLAELSLRLLSFVQRTWTMQGKKKSVVTLWKCSNGSNQTWELKVILKLHQWLWVLRVHFCVQLSKTFQNCSSLMCNLWYAYSSFIWSCSVFSMTDHFIYINFTYVHFQVKWHVTWWIHAGK